MYDVLVVGGGISGMSAAIAAAQSHKSVLLLEKNNVLGRKLKLTGGGRCNITNNRPVDDLFENIPGNGRFMHSAFSQFNNFDIMAFFKKIGVPLKEEDHGRMFPTTDRSTTIIEGLIDEMKRLGVKIQTNVSVEKLFIESRTLKGVQLEEGQILEAHAVIVATGGKTYPKTGSTGIGYTLAKQVGHTITPLFPTEAPLIVEQPFIKEKKLQGLSLRDINLSVLKPNGKPQITHTHDVLFTHFGLSGPAALRCAMFVNKRLMKNPDQEVRVSIDVFPDTSEGALKQQLLKIQSDEAAKSIKNALSSLIPERYLLLGLELKQIDADKPIQQLNEDELTTLIHYLKHFDFPVAHTWGLERAFVTGGGISLKEINPQTMESKLQPHLYFCGEVLDLNAYTGGFNITCAFVTGHVAGTHA